MKKSIRLVTAAVLLLSFIPASLAENAAPDAKTTLVNGIADTAASFISSDDSNLYMYKNMNWTTIADTLPATFDLRDRGVMPEVRDQGSMGTCWSFASIGAAEISILSSLGMTAEEFAEKAGFSLDLSEKHLAWFATSHLPELDKYAEGEYPYSESQAGEGAWHSNDDTDPTSAHFKTGGKMAFAAGIFANGIGPITEEVCPYTANDGSISYTKTWSVDEDLRYKTVAELRNSNILPTPAQHDADGIYYYNAAGTEAIKRN